MTIASPSILNGNLFTIIDSDFESGSPTWAAYSGANAPSITASYAFVGTHSLTWTANSTSDTFVASGYYPCIGNNGYDVSGYVITPNASHDTYIGMAFYDNTHTIIGSATYGADNVSNVNMWQPLVGLFTSPPTAKYFKVIVWCGTGVVNAEPFAIDLMYVTDTIATVWIDWSNPTFAPNSASGADFMDMTPWVRLDQNISMFHGRQDAISEVQSGQATFFVQNDIGWFTPQKSGSPYFPNIGLGARTQINESDQAGSWYTRFDGAISEITYEVDVTGGTNLGQFSCSDVLAYMNRQDPISCWTKQTILADNPWLHWTLNDSGQANICSESSGNNGPPLRAINYNINGTVAWNNTSAGVETLANSAAPTNFNDSQYWNPGSVVPTSPIRGLASGIVGPETTPLGSVFLTPNITAQSAQNVFVGTDGYQFNAQLVIGGSPAPMVTSLANFTIEAYFCMSSVVAAQSGKNLGPFTVISLGTVRQATCLVAGVYLNGGAFQLEYATYSQAPSFPFSSFGTTPPIISSNSATLSSAANLPHHLVMEIVAGTPATLNVWVDGASAGSITLPAGQIYDTVCVGGAYGGHGNFAGNISCVSIYEYLLSQSQIATHAMVGQYGYWEQTTDNCIGALGVYSGIPNFWNALGGQNNGLTLTDYQDISGSSPLSSMQTFEQAERGLLYVNTAGQLTFHTRDWRMGYGAADITIPASVYDATLGYELIDTFLLNEAATATTVFTTGVDWVSVASQNEYGSYSNGTQTSPIQLPLITWSRAWQQEGITASQFWPTPNLDDNSSWQVNTRNNPRLIPGQLTVDLLSIEPSSFIGGLTITNFLSLDTDNMLTLTGLPVKSFPDVTGVDDFFIEGINEIVGLGTRQITFYTSPASIQRAWKPGDSNYGILGTTSQLGISAPDVSNIPALGKTVSHDGGPPYWPPAFQTVPGGTQMGYTNGSSIAPVITPNVNSLQGDCLLVQVLSPAAATITVADTQNSGNYTNIGQVTLPTSGYVQYLFAYFNAQPLNSSIDSVTITTDLSRSYMTSLYRVWGVSGVDVAAHTATGTSTAPAVTGSGPMSATNDFELVIVANNNTEQMSIPSGWTQFWWNFFGTYQNQLFSRQATSTSPDAFSATLNGSSTPWGAIAISFTVNPFFMNNPSQNGHAFVGANDLRGIRDTIATALNPPLLVIGQINVAQTYTSGNNGIAGRMVWNSIYVDTAGGMGIVPGWGNWYCVMVPGFYEIMGQNEWAAQGSGAAGIRAAWIIVAQAAAAGVAAGTYSPYSGSTFVCPIGEQIPPNNNSKQVISSPSTRVYLGVGDMVSLGSMHNQGSSLNTGNGIAGGSWFSMRWVGFGNAADQFPTCGAPSGSSVTPQPTKKSTYTKTYTATDTYSYYGSGSSWSQPRNHNGTMYQGWYSGASSGGAGSQTSYALFNHSQIASDLSGATVNWVHLQMKNQHFWYYSGGSLMTGWTTNSSWGGSAPTGGMHYDVKETHFGYGQYSVIDIPVSIGNAFKSSGATALTFGNNSTTNLLYYSYWNGGSYPQLIINYTK